MRINCSVQGCYFRDKKGVCQAEEVTLAMGYSLGPSRLQCNNYISSTAVKGVVKLVREGKIGDGLESK